MFDECPHLLLHHLRVAQAQLPNGVEDQQELDGEDDQQNLHDVVHLFWNKYSHSWTWPTSHQQAFESDKIELTVLTGLQQRALHSPPFIL